jgi:hypothetical protein
VAAWLQPSAVVCLAHAVLAADVVDGQQAQEQGEKK